MSEPLEPVIILVEPQLGENIGSAARAMLNCGLTRMRIVRPRDGWPSERALAAASGADAVVLDLEDAVARDQKIAARPIARAALAGISGPLRCIRVNAFDTGLTAGDVAETVCADLDVIVLPKAEAAVDLRRLDSMLDAAEAAAGLPRGTVRVLPLVETCFGIDNAREIARASTRIIALAFGSGDLGRDLALPTIRGDLTAALAYGRGKIVYDARAAGRHAEAAGDPAGKHGRAAGGHRRQRHRVAADVALHAIADALYGALGEGDIGAHFPPSEPRWRGAESSIFLAHAAERVRARGGVIAHIDTTLICEAPKIGPYREAIRARIAEIAGIAITRTGLKATTSEGLGFTGRREGIACLATATIRLPPE